jgi:hypothetical protein
MACVMECWSPFGLFSERLPLLVAQAAELLLVYRAAVYHGHRRDPHLGK